MEKFWVKAGARLHLGQLDLNGSLGRLYGGLGLAIDQPHLEIRAERANYISLHSLCGEEKRLEKIVQKYLEYFNLPGVKIELIQTLPSHSGLGSGTQLSLALGFAITQVYEMHCSLTELATVTDRESSRSGIGVAAFERGGFLIDGGKRKNAVSEEKNFEVPPILARIPFPEDWAIILVLPYQQERMYGHKEVNAFNSLQPMEEVVSGNICRLLLMKLLPGLVEKDLVGFGEALTEIQSYLGNYFAPVQGGQYTSPQGSRIEEFLISQGVVGIGQSSWGPTIYGFTKQEKKNELLTRTRNFVGDQAYVWLAAGRNKGASFGWI